MRHTDVLYRSTKKSVSKHVENFTMVHIYLVPAVPSMSSVLQCPIRGICQVCGSCFGYVLVHQKSIDAWFSGVIGECEQTNLTVLQNLNAGLRALFWSIRSVITVDVSFSTVVHRFRPLYGQETRVDYHTTSPLS
jgi:hypothetical protein